MFSWINDNKKWLFSGIGASLIWFVVSFFSKGCSHEVVVENAGAKPVMPIVKVVHKNATEDKKKAIYVKKLEEEYVKLFDAYTKFFLGSLKPSAPEEVISDKLVEEVAWDIFWPSIDHVYLAIMPYNYASLFREQLGFYYYREVLKSPKDNFYVGWESYRDERNPIDNIYYQIGDEIEQSLREYFSDPKLLESFYHRKKVFIIKAIEERVSVRNKSAMHVLLGDIVNALDAFLKKENLDQFKEFLKKEAEWRVLYDSIQEKKDRSGGSQIEKDEILEAENRLEKVREEMNQMQVFLDKQSKNYKAYAFAYRRHMEGGDGLVKKYIELVTDVRNSLFN
ncbi:hypothetical protein [Desulfovibrio sp. JC010]|uniref:hypothetical protein n=1 Tax=Desulfovibrio sp. JC010 TaxID=2593641 RepID=UPI0013D057D5|nr:hypothetical protein [Desulfovibrio sp. JC010]NDV26429.1 hypothetical protein [Desulfovibrio sp. JC010]